MSKNRKITFDCLESLLKIQNIITVTSIHHKFNHVENLVDFLDINIHKIIHISLKHE